MRAQPGHREFEMLLGAFALDAVDVAEEQRIKRHVRACPACQREVASHRSIVIGILPSAIPPPSEVWERISAAVDADRRLGQKLREVEPSPDS